MKRNLNKTNPCQTILFGVLMLSFTALTAQTQVFYQDWVKTNEIQPGSESQSEIQARVLTANGGQGVMYVSNAVFNESTLVYDLKLEKLNNNGDLEWSQQYNIPNGGSIYVGGIVLDPLGLPVITGVVQNGANSYDVLTVKFNDMGGVIWSRTWNSAGNGYDAGSAVTTDGNGNVYVSGFTTGATLSSDFLLLKYNSSGSLVWSRQYDHAGYIDVAANVTAQPGYIVVTGGAQTAVNNWTLVAVRYNASTGVQVSANQVADNIVFDEINGFSTDDAHNLYIVGARNTGQAANMDYLILKLDANLNTQWEATFDYAGDKDFASAVTVDDGGGVYVTGTVTNETKNMDYMTLKLDANGVLQWKSVYDSGLGANERATDIAVDDNHHAYVTGAVNSDGREDYITIWYDAAGNEKWSERYNSVTDYKDIPYAITVDAEGGLLITGRNDGRNYDGADVTSVSTLRYGRSCGFVLPKSDELSSSAISFVQNNGQLLKTDGSPAPEVKYYTNANYPWICFQSEKLNYVTMEEQNGLESYHRVSMDFGRDDRARKLTPLEKRSDYFNFYLGHIQQGRTNVPLYDKLLYCDIYENIDLLLATNNSAVKYYYIMRPGADPKRIQNIFTGQTNLAIGGGDLIIGTTFGDIILSQPRAYEMDNSGNLTPLPWIPEYELNGNTQGFNTTGGYDNSGFLVFEITFNMCMDEVTVVDNNDWGTFYSGDLFSTKNFSDVRNDGSNNTFVTGNEIAADFPVGNGFQNSIVGGQDAFLIKFDSNVKRKFATFFGGTGQEYCYAVATDPNGKSYIVGSTTSGNTTFPLFNNGVAFFDNQNGCPPFFSSCLDAFIASFNADGTRNFATFYGLGNNNLKADDRAYDIQRNNKGEFYVVGQGSAALPAVGAPFEETDGTGFIARFNPNFSPIWSSTYKGNTIYAIDFDNNDNAFIAGFDNTGQINAFGPSDNSLQQSWNGGGGDGFIAKITDNPIDLVWSTYYGSADYEYFHGLAVDNTGNVYVAGYVGPNSNMQTFAPSQPGALYNSTSAGKDDCFLAKFNNDGEPLWGSYLGGPDLDQAFDIEIDKQNNVYITGKTYDSFTTASIPFQDYYYKDAVNTNSFKGDPFILALYPSLVPFWLTYYGGSDGENASSSSLSPDNTLYITGLIGILVDPATDYPWEDFDGNNQSNAYFQCDFGANTPNGVNVGGLIARFKLDETTSVTQPYSADTGQLMCYPNPASNYVQVEFDHSIEVDIVQVFDVTGACKIMFKNESETISPINIQSLADGVYCVKLTASQTGQSVSGKMIVHRQ